MKPLVASFVANWAVKNVKIIWPVNSVRTLPITIFMYSKHFYIV